MYTNGSCKVSFKFVRAIKLDVIGEEITSFVKSGHHFFIGTSKGRLLRYIVKKHVNRNQQVSLQAGPPIQVILGPNPITQLAVLPHLVVAMQGGYISLLYPDSLQRARHFSNPPPLGSSLGNSSSFGASLSTPIGTLGTTTSLGSLGTKVNSNAVLTLLDGGCSPFLGLAVASKKNIKIYNLQQLGSPIKTIPVKDQPKVIKWINKQILIGYSREYSLVTQNGEMGFERENSLMTMNHEPVMEMLPMDEFVFAGDTRAIFVSTDKQSREPIQFQWQPLQFAFSFPFLASLSVEAVEIRNVMDNKYHEYASGMPSHGIKMIYGDGKDIIAAGVNKVYMLVPSSNAYHTTNPVLFFQVHKNPSDSVLFITYFKKHVLKDQQNPFVALLYEYANKFIQKFFNPEEADLTQVKKYLGLSQKKLFKVFLLYFVEFKSKALRQQLYSVVQKGYFAKVFFTLIAMINKISTQDVHITSAVYQFYENSKPVDMGVRKRFWLTKESLSDAPQPDFEDESSLSKSRSNSDVGPERKNTTTEFVNFLEDPGKDVQPRLKLKEKMRIEEVCPEQSTVETLLKEENPTTKIEIPKNNNTNTENTEEETEPYHVAITILKKIWKKKTPKDKLDCIVSAFQSIIVAINYFWKHYNREVIVGADDLVPIFTYVILKAAIPKIHSEMNFIWEFAREEELVGRNGYAFATFQIGVEVLTNLSMEDARKTGIKEESEKSNILSDSTNSSISSEDQKRRITFEPLFQKKKSISIPVATRNSLRFSLKINRDVTFTDAIGKHRDDFFTFLKQEKNSEYLLFLEAILSFKKNPTQIQAEEIVSKFMSPSMAVSIPIKLKNEVILAVKSQNQIFVTIFDGIHEELMYVLERDIFPRFVLGMVGL